MTKSKRREGGGGEKKVSISSRKILACYISKHFTDRVFWQHHSIYSQQLQIGQATQQPRGDGGDLVSIENPEETMEGRSGEGQKAAGRGGGR